MFSKKCFIVSLLIIFFSFSYLPKVFGQVANDYPRITQLEEKVFHKNYNTENIYLRLNRLEQRIFGTIFPDSSLSERTDKLSSALNGDEFSDNANNFDTQTEISSNSGSVFGGVSDLEAREFGRTFDNDLINERLERLEIKILGGAQSGTIDSRLNRLYMTINNNSMNLYSGGFSQNQTSPPKSGLMNLIQTLLMNFTNGYINQVPNYGGPVWRLHHYPVYNNVLSGYPVNSFYGINNPPYQIQTNPYGENSFGLGAKILP